MNSIKLYIKKNYIGTSHMFIYINFYVWIYLPTYILLFTICRYIEKIIISKLVNKAMIYRIGNIGSKV